MKWYYEQGGQQEGPVDKDQLCALLADGTLAPTNKVWSKELSDWMPASEVSALNASGPPPFVPQYDAPEADEPMGADAFSQLVFEALASYGAEIADLFIGSDIPDAKLRNATPLCGVPAGETILALLDATVFGSAKNALLVGVQGIYMHNAWSAAFPGQASVDYQRLRNCTLTSEKSFEVTLCEGVAFSSAGSSASVAQTTAILGAIQRILRETGYGDPDHQGGGDASSYAKSDTKECPMCAEDVKARAKICRFCNHTF